MASSSCLRRDRDLRTAASPLISPMRSAHSRIRSSPAPLYWSGFLYRRQRGVGWSNGGNVRVFDPVLGPQSIGVNSHSGFIGGRPNRLSTSSRRVRGMVLRRTSQYANIGSSVNWGPMTSWSKYGSSGEYFGTLRAPAGTQSIGRSSIWTGGLALAA